MDFRQCSPEIKNTSTLSVCVSCLSCWREIEQGRVAVWKRSGIGIGE